MQLLEIKLKELKNVMSRELDTLTDVIFEHYGVVKGFGEEYGEGWPAHKANKLLATAQRDIFSVTTIGVIAELVEVSELGTRACGFIANPDLWRSNQGYVGSINEAFRELTLSTNGVVDIETDPIGMAFRPDYAVMAYVKALRANLRGGSIGTASRLGSTLGFRKGGDLNVDVAGATGFMPSQKALDHLRSTRIRDTLNREDEPVFQGSGLADHILLNQLPIFTAEQLVGVAWALKFEGVSIN